VELLHILHHFHNQLTSKDSDFIVNGQRGNIEVITARNAILAQTIRNHSSRIFA